MNFSESLDFGVAGESHIARWLRNRGWAVLPAYEKILDDHKGPRVYLPQGRLIAPDLLAFKADGALWVEAKHKTAFTWHRLTQQWVTGIDLRHYEDYCRIEDETPWPVWLLFLHEGGQAKDSPPDSPEGLFGGRLAYLRRHEHHRHSNWGSSGMVYWALGSLKRIAGRADVRASVAALR